MIGNYGMEARFPYSKALHLMQFLLQLSLL